MPFKAYWASVRVGGGTGAGDKIDGAGLIDKDILALLESTDTARFYWLDDDASGSEGEGVTNPDTNPGTKSWLLLGITVPNTGLHILDTDASHDLIIKPNEDISADRTLNLVLADADRTFTLNENLTVADGYDVTVQALGQANSLILNESLTIGNGNDGTITFSAASKVLTIDESETISNYLLKNGDRAMTGHLTLFITDTDGTTEGDIWYDASEDKLKFRTASGVETITSA